MLLTKRSRVTSICRNGKLKTGTKERMDNDVTGRARGLSCICSDFSFVSFPLPVPCSLFHVLNFIIFKFMWRVQSKIMIISDNRKQVVIV